MEIDLTGLVLPEKVETVESSEDGRVAEFVVEPLERGYGHTLGNSIRRVLLASLRGSAVWAFRIDGVVHEHQTVPGVAEDIHQVIQNLKALVVTLDDDVVLDEAPQEDYDDGEDGGLDGLLAPAEPKQRPRLPAGVTLELTASKAGPVTAADIKERAGVRILDPDHHILTLQEDRDFRMELRVNRGRGFVLADQHPVGKGEPVDLVRIDAIYNPVRRANFEVRETRVGQRTDFDQLTLHVETDGTVTPEDAVAVAAELLRKHMEYFLYFGEGGMPTTAPKGAVPVPEQTLDLFLRTIEDLAELSVRSRNSLQKENIRTLGDLVQKTEDEMLEIENFGQKSLKEIQDFLADHNLRFGMQLEKGDDGSLFFFPDEVTETADRGDE